MMETKGNSDNENTPPVILVAIDSPSVRKYVGMAIKMAGYTIIMAVDGDDAIEKIQCIIPQLVIVDIDDKAKKLVTFLKEKYNSQHIPIIVITQNYPSEAWGERFPFADAIMAKPFTFSGIVQLVKSNLTL